MPRVTPPQPWRLPAIVPSDVSECDRDQDAQPFPNSGSSERDRFDADCGFAIALFWLVGTITVVAWLVR